LRLRRWPFVVGLVVLLLGAGGAAWGLTRGGGSSATTQLVAAKRTTVSQTVSASGTIAPTHEADLDFAVSGRVTSVKVKAGDTVTKGEVLATVGRAALADAVASAEASYSSATAQRS
jgi:macrolide-specific efflux system membrane fusion protein